jgi:hypothetical protein
VKHFVKAMDQNGNVFLYLKHKFLRINESKIKEGILVSPQIKEIMRQCAFKKTLSEAEGAAWRAFKPVTTISPETSSQRIMSNLKKSSISTHIRCKIN